MAPPTLLTETNTITSQRLLGTNTVLDSPKSESITERKQILSEILQTRTPIKWFNAIFLTLMHLWAIYSFILMHLQVTFWHLVTIYLWSTSITVLYGIGVTGGAHRLWTHRSYKAKRPLRYFYIFLYLGAGMNKLTYWVADHRVHHKYTDTDADPHNINRGFFFAHMGWLMLRKHPDVIKRIKQMNMSDVYDDPVVQFQEKYYWPILILMCFVVPTMVPVLLWNESLWLSFISNSVIRYIIGLNLTWTVNSVAHTFGTKPYDNHITSTEQFWVSLMTVGEGWHNYHHMFPWDYKASEWGRINLTTNFLHLCRRMGWAYDFKEASEELISKVASTHGDGSRLLNKDKIL